MVGHDEMCAEMNDKVHPSLLLWWKNDPKAEPIIVASCEAVEDAFAAVTELRMSPVFLECLACQSLTTHHVSAIAIVPTKIMIVPGSHDGRMSPESSQTRNL